MRSAESQFETASEESNAAPTARIETTTARLERRRRAVRDENVRQALASLEDPTPDQCLAIFALADRLSARLVGGTINRLETARGEEQQRSVAVALDLFQD